MCKPSTKRLARAQEAANAQAERQAQQEAQRAEEAYNRANQKMPDITAAILRNRQAGQQGVGSTFLTGARGVDTSKLMLTRNTPLGG